MAVTQQQLVRDLEDLGVPRGGSVMMHSSLSRLGPVEGGAEAAVDALLEVVGPDGTLLVPGFRSGGPDPADYTNSDCDCSSADGLCPSDQPGFQGVIPEAVRRRPGTLRSCHPTHSWVGLGPAARGLLKTHRGSPTPCGPGAPFENMAPDDVVLLLGVGVDRATLWHYYEERVGAPYRGHYRPNERHIVYTPAGRRLQYDHPGVLQDICRAAGVLRTGPVGKSTSGIMRVGAFKQFQATVIADDPYCMVLRPPDRDSYYLAVDAFRKAEGMLKAWRRGPVEPRDFFVGPRPVKPPAENETVRTDCPAFAGLHEADGRRIPLCKANGVHPDFRQLGGAFESNGIATCSDCSWHLKFPVAASSERPGGGA